MGRGVATERDVPQPTPHPIAISAGCPCGVGLELLLPALAAAKLPAGVRFLFCGPRALVQEGARRAGFPWTDEGSALLVGGTTLEFAASDDLVPALRDDAVTPENVRELFAPGRPQQNALDVQRESLLHAIALAQSGAVRGMVTLPIRKRALDAVDGEDFPGHTELLSARLADEKGPALMVFAGGPFLLGLATVHLPLAQVSAEITKEKIAHAIARLIDVTAAYSGKQRPKVVILGHNPHAGEGGRLGTEELDAIAPAIAAMRSQREVELIGPLPADGFFAHHQHDPPDAVLAMHHDQGLAPYKILSGGRGVNVTWGLRCARTSPDHGTADDIAGTGRADPASLQAALELCARVVHRQKGGAAAR